MELTPNFSLEEFTLSNTAVRLGIDNTPSIEVINNLSLLVKFVLEPLRTKLAEKFGKPTPVIITSGYRSPKLNAAVGGSKTSQHLEGKAADIHVPGMTTEELFLFITENLSYDQCIQEFDSWVHISWANRNETLRATKVKGATGTITKYTKV